MSKEVLSKRIKTTEGWGSSSGNTLKVLFLQLPDEFEVSVWGNPSFGFKRIFLSREQALKAYENCTDFTSQVELWSNGFDHVDQG